MAISELVIGKLLFDYEFVCFMQIFRCSGGVGIKSLDKLVQFVSRFLNESVDWDSETIGCFSPRSHLLADVFAEIADWLAQPENAREVLVLMFDDQEDLQTWGKVPMLMDLIGQVHGHVTGDIVCAKMCLPCGQYFGDMVYTPSDKQRLTPNGWPTLGQLVTLGKRVIFANGQDYGEDMSPYVFYKYVCLFVVVYVLLTHVPLILHGRYGPLFDGWSESSPDDLHEYPECTLRGLHTQTGQILRVVDGDLAYGPFYNESTDGNIVPSNAFTYVQCGVNWPSMDQARPELVAAGKDVIGRLCDCIDNILFCWVGIWTWDVAEPAAGGCATVGPVTSRWHALSCTQSMYYACRNASNPLDFVLSSLQGNAEHVFSLISC